MGKTRFGSKTAKTHPNVPQNNGKTKKIAAAKLMEEVAIANSATMKIKEEKILAERLEGFLRDIRAPLCSFCPAKSSQLWRFFSRKNRAAKR